MNDLDQVPGLEGGVSVPETPAPDSGVVAQPTMPAQTAQVDVDALKQKYEKDINSLKSTLQKQTAQVEKEWQSRYSVLEQKVHEARMDKMTDEERASYERQLESEEFQTLKSRLAELENERALQAQTVNAYGFFMQQGVPANLLNLSEGYDSVVNAGWAFLIEERNQLKAQLANPPQPKPVDPAPLKGAPNVVTDKGTPASGTTWAALRQRFGSDEAVYRAIEEQRLDPSVLPPY